MNDICELIDTELHNLIATLESLTDEQWATPSLCAGWSVRDVAVHLLMPYELTAPRFLTKMVVSGFNFDRVADRWAKADPRATARIVAALRGTAHAAFRVPGAPPEAPLSHLVCHAGDIYRPLGVAHQPNPLSADITLAQLVSPRARRSLPAGVLDGLAFRATDTGWSHGDGAPVTGTASALITVITGRAAALQDISGDGAAQLAARLSPPDSRHAERAA